MTAVPDADRAGPLRGKFRGWAGVPGGTGFRSGGTGKSVMHAVASGG
jgi:hypothetical protein